MEWWTGSKFGKEYEMAVYMSSCLFNLYAEYIMWNAGLHESQTGIKVARRNISNLRYADYTSLTAENKEELKNLLIKAEKSKKVGLKLIIEKMKIMASSPITSWQIDGETMEIVRDSFSWASKSPQCCKVIVQLK